MLEAELAGKAKLVVCGFGQCLRGQNRTKTGHDRAGQGMMRTGEVALLGFIPSDMFVDHTTVSAVPICPFSQRTLQVLNIFHIKKKYFNFLSLRL